MDCKEAQVNGQALVGALQIPLFAPVDLGPTKDGLDDLSRDNLLRGAMVRESVARASARPG